VGQRSVDGGRVKFRELPTAIIGRLGELAAAREFRRDGAGVIASFKYSGENDNEAPALELEDCREILPDLDVCKRGQRCWIEIKTYSHAEYNRTYRCTVHGISTRHYDNYVAVEERTGSAVYLAINELDTGLLIVTNRPLSQMQKYPCLCGCKSQPALCRVRRSKGNNYPQWYFDRDTFTARYRFDDKTIQHLRGERDRLLKPSHVLQRHGSERRVYAQGLLSFEQPTALRDPTRNDD
jgi:hypothetical protein